MIILSENKEGVRLLSRAGGISSTREVSPREIQGLLLCLSPAVMGGHPLFDSYIAPLEQTVA